MLIGAVYVTISEASEPSADSTKLLSLEYANNMCLSTYLPSDKKKTNENGIAPNLVSSKIRTKSIQN